MMCPSHQFVGLPYMAHDSHSEDTLFVVSEQDFVFLREDAEVHDMYLSQQEMLTCQWQRFEEIADAMPDGQEKH